MHGSRSTSRSRRAPGRYTPPVQSSHVAPRTTPLVTTSRFDLDMKDVNTKAIVSDHSQPQQLTSSQPQHGGSNMGRRATGMRTLAQARALRVPAADDDDDDGEDSERATPQSGMSSLHASLAPAPKQRRLTGFIRHPNDLLGDVGDDDDDNDDDVGTDKERTTKEQGTVKGAEVEEEEEYERLVFSQPVRGASPGAGRLGDAARIGTRSPGLAKRTETQLRPQPPSTEDDEDSRAAAAAASRFSAMKLGLVGADMNATLTGGGGAGTGGNDTLRGGLLSFQLTGQGSFGVPVVKEATLNDTLGRQQRAAMLLAGPSVTAEAGATTMNGSDVEGINGSHNTRALPSRSGGGGTKKDLPFNSTFNSTTGLGTAIDDLRATLHSTLHDGSLDDHPMLLSEKDNEKGIVPLLSHGRVAPSPARGASTGGGGGGNRVRFANTDTTSLDSTALASHNVPDFAHRPTTVFAPSRPNDKPPRAEVAGPLKPAGAASTRTMAALGRLYTGSPAATYSPAPALLAASRGAGGVTAGASTTTTTASAAAASALAAQHAPLASLRYEDLTVDALRRRFGPSELLSENLHRHKETFLHDDFSVYSIRSSAADSTFGDVGAGDAAAMLARDQRSRGMTAAPRLMPAMKAGTTTATTTTKGREGSGQASATISALTQIYVEDLYTPEAVLREMHVKQSPAPPNDGHTTTAHDAPHRSPPMPDLDDPQAVERWKVERRRARESRQRLAVRDVTGAGKTSDDVLSAALHSNARLLHEYAMRRPANEKLRNKVTQWLDRINVVVLHDPRRAGRGGGRDAASAASPTAGASLAAPSKGTSVFVLVEEDPSEQHDAIMRVMHAEEADVQARNLLERGRLLEGGQPQSSPAAAAGGAGASVPGTRGGAMGGVVPPPMAARSGLFGEPAPTDPFSSGPSTRAPRAALLQHTSLASRLNPWGFSAQELSDQEAPVFQSSAAVAGALLPPPLQANGEDGDYGVTEAAASRRDSTATVTLQVGSRSEERRESRSVTDVSAGPFADHRAKPTALSGGERELLDFAMQTVFHSSYAHHLRAFVQSRTAAGGGGGAGVQQGDVPTSSTAVTFKKNGDHVADRETRRQQPAFLATLRPETLVTTATYESTSAAWLRGVNEMLHVWQSAPEATSSHRTSPPPAATNDHGAQTDGGSRPSLSTSAAAAECDSEVVSLAALPMRLQYALPLGPLPGSSNNNNNTVNTTSSPTRASLGAASSSVWEVTLDLLDVVAHLPARAVEKLLELASARPTQDLVGPTANTTAATATTAGGVGAGTSLTAAAGASFHERPHSRSQSFFGMGFATSATSMPRLDAGAADGARLRRNSGVAFNIPSWCKAAWRRALAEAVRIAETAPAHASSVSSSRAGSPRTSRSPSRHSTDASTGSPARMSPSPSVRRGSTLTIHTTTATTATTDAAPARSSSPFLTTVRPNAAELRSFSFQTRLAVEQSQWRVAHAMTLAVTCAAHTALLTPPSEDLVPPPTTSETAAHSGEPAADENLRTTTTASAWLPSSKDSLNSTASAFLPRIVTPQNAFYFSVDMEKRMQPGGPHWLGLLPVAPPSRLVYPFDMRHLYVIATLAVEETEGQLLPRLQRIRTQYKKQCQEALRRGSKVRGSGAGRGSDGGAHGTAVARASMTSLGSELFPGFTAEAENRRVEMNNLRARIASAKSQRSLPTLSSQVMASTTAMPLLIGPAHGGPSSSSSPSLCESLEQWAAAQRLIALETEFVNTVSSIYRNEVAVNHFNSHVRPFNRYQERQRWLWSPVYRAGLRVSYHLCLLLSERGLESLPESYVRLLHPVAHFVGCMGGHREMRANLPEVLIDIVERAKRVHLPLDPIIATAFRDPDSEQDMLLDAVATACDGSHPRAEATAPYGTVANPEKPFTEAEAEAVKGVEAVYAVDADEPIRPADLVSCVATEADELNVPLKSVTFPSVRFRAIEPLVAGLGL